MSNEHQNVRKIQLKIKFIRNSKFISHVCRILLKFTLFFILISQSIGSFVLYCYYNNHYYGYIGNNYVGTAYACEGVVDVIEDDSREILMVYGNHLSKQSAETVQFFHISNEILTTMPTNLDIFFPNLRGIIVQKSNLIHLSCDDLKSFYNLTIFSATGNPLESIDGDLFRYNPSLQLVDLSSNKIREIGENLLLTLPKLKEAYFAKNLCVDENAKSPIEILRLNVKLPRLCPKRSASTSVVEMPIET